MLMKRSKLQGEEQRWRDLFWKDYDLALTGLLSNGRVTWFRWVIMIINFYSAISQWSNSTLQNCYSSQLNQGAGILSHWTPCVYTQSVVQSKMSKCLGLAKKNATLAKSCSYWTRSFLQSASTCYKDLTDMKTEIPSYIMYMHTIRLW